MFKNVTPFSLLIFSLVLFVASACGDDTYYYENDYSDVPDLADTTSAISKTTTDDGIIIYVIEEGDTTDLQVGMRDLLGVYCTTRYADTEQYQGEDAIVQSTYANGITTSYAITTAGGSASSSTTCYEYAPSYFADGILGMYTGGHRVLYFPDSLTALSSDLVIDFELEAIQY